ncbi:MAG: hypothetical protein WDW36_007667 [Sanguina aurantia]
MLKHSSIGLLKSLTASSGSLSQVSGFSSKSIEVTLFPGDGIGPEIAAAAKLVFTAAGLDIQWDEQHVGKTVDTRTNSMVTRENLDSMLRNKIGLKGPMTTPIGKGFRSLNLTLRKELDLYANVRPCFSIPGFRTRYDNVNLVTVRENTEGEYSGLEHEVVPGVVESLKLRPPVRKGRKKITAVHKANILKTSTGLFLNVAREIAREYPQIEFSEMIVDNTCMQLVMNPHQFDVIVTTNLFGDILSDLCAGLVGGLGLAPGDNIGTTGLNGLAMAEAVHGTAPDLAGKNKANPTALLLSGVMMLRHLGLNDEAERIQKAVLDTIAEGKYRTGDLGGTSTTSDYTKAIIGRL